MNSNVIVRSRVSYVHAEAFQRGVPVRCPPPGSLARWETDGGAVNPYGDDPRDWFEKQSELQV